MVKTKTGGAGKNPEAGSDPESDNVRSCGDDLTPEEMVELQELSQKVDQLSQTMTQVEARLSALERGQQRSRKAIWW